MGQFILPRPMALDWLTPADLRNNAAWYSLADSAGDSTYRIDGSNRLMLVADRSGNSAVNGLILPGAASNTATTPSAAALLPTGNIEIQAWIAPNKWLSAAANGCIASRDDIGSSRSYGFYLLTDGTFSFGVSTNGSAMTFYPSTAAVAFADYSVNWARVTRNSTTGDIIFYTSSDGVTWTKLGNTVPGMTGNVYSGGSRVLQIGAQADSSSLFAGRVLRVKIYAGFSDAAGTLAFDANFTAQAKLATSFTESSSNAATVTINSSGDLGARICGARDLVQLTASKQPAFSTGADGINILTYDGVNDYMKSAPFSLSQPESVYFTGSQVSWTGSDTLFDGGAASNRMAVYQSQSSPTLRLEGGSTPATNFSEFPVGQRGILRAVVNGASSSMAFNRGAMTAINAGTNAANGFTLGAYAGINYYANITFSEIIIRSAADDEAMQLRIANYLIRKWGISV